VLKTEGAMRNISNEPNGRPAPRFGHPKAKRRDQPQRNHHTLNAHVKEKRGTWRGKK